MDIRSITSSSDDSICSQILEDVMNEENGFTGPDECLEEMDPQFTIRDEDSEADFQDFGGKYLDTDDTYLYNADSEDVDEEVDTETNIKDTVIYPNKNLTDVVLREYAYAENVDYEYETDDMYVEKANTKVYADEDTVNVSEDEADEDADEDNDDDIDSCEIDDVNISKSRTRHIKVPMKGNTQFNDKSNNCTRSHNLELQCGAGKDRPKPLVRHQKLDDFYLPGDDNSLKWQEQIDMQGDVVIENEQRQNVEISQLTSEEDESLTIDEEFYEKEHKFVTDSYTYKGGKVKVSTPFSDFDHLCYSDQGGKVAASVSNNIDEKMVYKLGEKILSSNYDQSMDNKCNINHRIRRSIVEDAQRQGEFRLYNRVIMAGRAKLHKKPILRLLQSLHINIDKYLAFDIKSGLYSSNESSDFCYSSSGNICTEQSLTQMMQNEKRTEPAFVQGTSELETVIDETDSVAKGGLNINGRILRDLKTEKKDIRELVKENDSVVIGNIETADEDAETIGSSSSEQCLFQKDDTLSWCHQQIGVAERLWPSKSKKARLDKKDGGSLFYETVLADSLPSESNEKLGSTNGYSHLGLLKDPDRVQSPQLLDEVLTVLIAAAKVYIMEILVKAQEIAETEHQTNGKRKYHQVKETCKYVHQCSLANNQENLPNNISINNYGESTYSTSQTENCFSTEQNYVSRRIISSKHVYEAARRMN